MPRKVDRVEKLCVICGDKAKGINFNCQTCMSCKAFFRRNALRNKEMKCPFQDACVVNKITRKFCSKCRLKKCFTAGMKKEWILSEEEKQVIKEKIMQNRLKRQEQGMLQQNGGGGGHQKHHHQAQQQHRQQQQQHQHRQPHRHAKAYETGASRNMARASARGAAAAYYSHGNGRRQRGGGGGGGATITSKQEFFDAAANNNGSSTTTSPASVYFNSQSASESIFSNVDALFYPLKSSSLANIFTDPASYSLDMLLKTDCEELNNYAMEVPPVEAMSFAADENYPGGHNNLHSTGGLGMGEMELLLNSKKDFFLYSPTIEENLSEFDDNLTQSLMMEDDFAFSGDLDLFDNDIDNINASFTSSGSETSGEKNLSDDYNPIISEKTLAMNLDDIDAGLKVTNNNTNTTTTTTNIVKDKNDFTQYLLHDTDPFTFQEMNHSHTKTSFNASATTNITTNYSNNSMVLFNQAQHNTAAQPNQVKRLKLDYMATCLNSIDDDESSNANNYYDPVLGTFSSRITSAAADTSLFRDIRCSNRELIQPERFMIKELSEACVVLHNPYKRILYINSVMNHQCQIVEFFIHRLIRMAKRLSAFNQLSGASQGELLKRNLLKMLGIRSVVLYDKDREAWFFLDDKCKVTIVVNIDIIKSSCSNGSFQKHKRFPMMFMNEWKTDSVIFDLLTAITLFTPEPGMPDRNKIHEENIRYTYLLRRYLEIKYPTISEAKSCFVRLMKGLDEMRELNIDIVRFFVQTSKFHSSPLFKEILAHYQNVYNDNNGTVVADTNNDNTNKNGGNADANDCGVVGPEMIAQSIGSNLNVGNSFQQPQQQQQPTTTTTSNIGNQQCGMSVNCDYNELFNATTLFGSDTNNNLSVDDDIFLSAGIDMPNGSMGTTMGGGGLGAAGLTANNTTGIFPTSTTNTNNNNTNNANNYASCGAINECFLNSVN